MSVVTPSLRAAIAVPGWAKNELWRKARAVPSLDLRFADSKSLVDATTGSNLVTFTRASSGTYVGSDGVLQTAVTDVPRFDHNPITGESLGLLVEEQRTNSFEWSNSATQGETWNNVGPLLNLASGQSDPAGGTAGIRATDANSVSAGTYLQRTSLANLTAGTTVTYSVWLKPIDCPNNFITLTVFANTTTDNMFATFSVSGTAITAASASANGTGVASGASFEVFPNGWYRCRLTGVPSTVTMADVRARINLGSYQRAAGTDRFDWYGAQLESGAFATSYIPTSGAAATRNADVASITGSAFSGWYRQDEGTVFVDCKVIGDNGSNQFIYSISDGALGDEIRLFKPSTNSSITNGIEDSVDGTTNNIFANANTPFGQSFKTAYAFANNYASRAAGGLASEVDNSVTVPSVNQIRIGARMNGTFYSNLYLSRLTYWPQGLASSTLQQITQ